MKEESAASVKARIGYDLPAFSTDSHCHIFGPANLFPYSATRTYTPEDKPKEALRALHDHLGLQRAVIVQASCHGTDNRAMLDALHHDPKRYRGVCMANDETTDADLKELHDAGVRGVRFNFIARIGGGPNMDLFHRTVKRCAKLGWHVVMQVQNDGIRELESVIRALPCPFVIDHMARTDPALGAEAPAIQTLLKLMESDDCWVKLSGAERLDDEPFDLALPIARAIQKQRPDRVLWGTDFPHPNMQHEVDEVALMTFIGKVVQTLADRQAMFVDNPAKLYEWPKA